MKRQLFVCNSVYQILVAIWIKFTYFKKISSDLLISDHMNNPEKLVINVSETGVFDHVYFIRTLGYVRNSGAMSRTKRIAINLFPNHYVKKFVKLKEDYTDLFVANVNCFAQLLFNALSHKNPRIKLSIFEDGMYTYSSMYEKDYNGTFIPIENMWKIILHKCIYRRKSIYGNVSSLWLFCPENLMWVPDFPVKEMSKISKSNKKFVSLCNLAFDYANTKDTYNKKYIFLEESFYAENKRINDVEIVEKIAENVGKENIMIKIHPRNPYNRFANLGYKTNIDTSIPWEVIIMNVDMSKKVLITISSSSVLNPILIFGEKIRVYSIYKCIESEDGTEEFLTNEMWEITYKIFRKYSDMITICDSTDEIV